jgi:hypothetical protein
MKQTTKKILKRAEFLATKWENESLSACGHSELVARAFERRRVLFSYLRDEIERLVEKAGEL